MTPSSRLPNLTNDTWDFINKIESQNTKPLYEFSVQDARNFLRKIQEENHKKIDAEINEIEIENIKTFIVRPTQKIDKKLPVILYLHGGGWIMGDEYVYDNLIKKIANCAQAAVVFPEYSHAPEFHYPQQINEIYSVLKYIAEHYEELNFDIEKFVIAGDSAGANMAAVTAMRTKNDNSVPKIKFELLIYPVTNADMDTDSYENFKDGPWLTKKAMEWFWEAYVPDKKNRKDKFVSPLYADLEDLRGLATTFIITAENDVLCDEGEAYARKLDDAGVDVINVRINGTFHDFLMLNDLAETEPVKTTLKMICGVLREEFK